MSQNFLTIRRRMPGVHYGRMLAEQRRRNEICVVIALVIFTNALTLLITIKSMRQETWNNPTPIAGIFTIPDPGDLAGSSASPPADPFGEVKNRIRQAHMLFSRMVELPVPERQPVQEEALKLLDQAAGDIQARPEIESEGRRLATKVQQLKNDIIRVGGY